MRNFLIHDYNSINLEVIWKTLNKDITELKKYVENVLTKRE